MADETEEESTSTPRAPRAQWKAMIEIGGGKGGSGAFSVPVKLYGAVRPQEIHFRQLHDQDETPVRQVLECPVENKEVPREHAVKGYEFRRDQYVIVRDEDLENCGPVASRTISVRHFVNLDDIDPVYFDKPYFLGPDVGGQKGYAVLARALEETKLAAIAEFVLRGKEYLAAIRAYRERGRGGDDEEGDGPLALCLQTMFYADEVVPVEEIEQMAEDVDRVTSSTRSRAKTGAREEREVAMAQQLVESLSGDFDPSQYHDEYRKCVMDLIEKKAAGHKVVFHKTRGPKVTKAIDLTSVLKASLEHVKKNRKRGADNGAT
jgi:DNA end-binding protein Ku